MNLYPCFLHFLLDFGDILFRCSAHNDGGSGLWVSWKSVQWSPYFFCGHNWNYIYMCAVKQYYMLDVKNTLVKSIILCHRLHHLQCCVLTEEFIEYNQQDAVFHNFFISVRCSTCFRRFFCPTSGAQNCTYIVSYLSDQCCYLPLAWLAAGKTAWNV